MNIYHASYLVNLADPSMTRALGVQLFAKDALSHRFEAVVYDSDAPDTAPSLGTLTGVVLLPNGETLPLTAQDGGTRTVRTPKGGTAVASVASVTLDQDALLLPGRVVITIRGTGQPAGRSVSLLSLSCTVVRVESDAWIEPGTLLPNVSQLQTAVTNANTATTAATNAAASATAAALAGVRTDTDEQGLTDTQKANARTNIDAADVTTVNALGLDLQDTNAVVLQHGMQLTTLGGRVTAVEETAENAATAMNSDAEHVDLDVSDEDGNVILRLADGHIQTKEFSSRMTPVRSSGSDAAADLDVADINGNVALRLAGGQIRTKAFDSARVRQLAGMKWAVIGDSLTEHNSRATMNYHDYVAQETGITVVNLGKSGRGYAAGYADGTNFISKVSSIPSDTDVITIFGSGNDKSLIQTIPLGDITDDDGTTLCGYINLTLDAIFDAFPLVPLGIITPTPWKNSEPSDGNTTMAQYCEKLVQICARRGIPCLDLFHCSNLHPDDADFREIAYSRDTNPETGELDGVHPDENGHRFIAPRFREFLFSLI